MQWKKIHLTIPSEVLNIYQAIHKIQKNSCIAGGFLSDLYMKKPYNDVDIFLKADEKKIQRIDYAMKQLGYKSKKGEDFESEYPLSFQVNTYIKGKWTFQLVFSDMGITRVKFFDFRMREFFYFKNQCYASKEALEDIQEEKLVIGVPCYPMKTFFRIHQFMKRYSFKIDSKSVNHFSLFFNQEHYQLFDLNHFYEMNKKQYDKSIYDQLKKHFNGTWIILPHSFKEGDVPQGIIEKIHMHPIQRDLIEKVFEKRNKNALFSASLSDQHIENMENHFAESKESILKELNKQRIRFLSTGYLTFYHESKEKLENMTLSKASDIRNIYRELTRYDLDFCDKLKDLHLEMNFLSQFFTNLKRSIEFNRAEIKIYENFSYLRVKNIYQLKEYAKKNIFIFAFPNIGSFSYHIKTGEIIDASNIINSAAPFIRHLIDQHYPEIKRLA